MTSLETFYQFQKTQANHSAIIDATVEDGRHLTYAELFDSSAKIAQLLHQHELSSGDRIAAMLPNGLDLALLYLACLHCGITIVPVNPALPQTDINYILQLTQPKVFILAQQFADHLLVDDINRWVVTNNDELQFQSSNLSPAAFQANSENILSIFFTSGTTNRPKAVCHSVANMLDNVTAYNQHMGWDNNCRMLHVLPMTYMAGFLNTLLSPLLTGGSVILAPQFDAATALRFWQPAMQHQANTMWLSPTMLALLSQLDRDEKVRQWTAQHIKHICVGTAPLPAAIKQDFEQRFGVTCYESYGMTEILLVAGNTPLHSQIDGSVGGLLKDVQAKTTDEGDLWIKTPFALAGYLNPQSGTLDSPLEDGWMDTGDLGHLDDERQLHITGRKKDLIIHGGTNVSPRAVEEVLLQHPQIQDAAVIGVPHAFYGEEIIALLILNDQQQLNDHSASIRDLCKQNLNAASQPAKFIQHAEFPRSVTGKVQKHVLRQQWLEKNTKGST